LIVILFLEHHYYLVRISYSAENDWNYDQALKMYRFLSHAASSMPSGPQKNVENKGNHQPSPFPLLSSVTLHPPDVKPSKQTNKLVNNYVNDHTDVLQNNDMDRGDVISYRAAAPPTINNSKLINGQLVEYRNSGTTPRDNGFHVQLIDYGNTNVGHQDSEILQRGESSAAVAGAVQDVVVHSLVLAPSTQSAVIVRIEPDSFCK